MATHETDVPKIDTYFGRFDRNIYHGLCWDLFEAMEGGGPRLGDAGMHFAINGSEYVILSHVGGELIAIVRRYGATSRDVLDSLSRAGLRKERKHESADLSDCVQEGFDAHPSPLLAQ